MLLACGLATTVVMAGPLMPAYADFIAPPVVDIPVGLVGVGSETGTVAGVAETLPVTGPVVAGIGAFAGTCWVLGKLIKDHSCGDGWSNIAHALFSFGSTGDARQSVNGYTASCSLTTPITFCAELDTVALGNGSTNKIINATWTRPSSGAFTTISCNNGTWNGTVAITGFASYPTASTGCYGAWSNGTPTSLTGSGSVYLSHVWVTGATGTIDWSPDLGAGSPWTIVTTVTCKHGATSATGSVTTTFTPAPNTAVPDVTIPTCDTILPGGALTGVVTTGGRTGGATDVTVTVPTFNSTATTSYPLCTNGSIGECNLVLKRNGVTCAGGTVWCAGWMAYESEMTCSWGPYSVAISYCESAYGTAYDLETNPTPSPSASPTTTTGTGTGTFPSGGPNPNPSSGTFPTASPVPTTGFAPDPTDTNGSNCMGAAWSWNPVNWVYVPVKCALSWAFVPSTAALEADVSSVQSAWSTSSVGTFLTGVAAVPAAMGNVGGSGDCNGPSFSFPMPGGHSPVTVHPFQACVDPMAHVASITKTIAGILVLLGSGVLAQRIILGSLGMPYLTLRRGDESA